ncbi:uncharacterized protein [Rutidosis leptorrhynchoides]|uniref:uncharacterized protein n=1 Tax=Rutidosis leptorrhynchoides TaxID=125765 RepID=UPI003A99E415
MDPDPLSGPTTPTDSPKIQSTSQSPVKDETFIKSDDHNKRSSDAVSSPTQSPTLQVMERLEDCSNRCSSSSEWSSVSNESLFSIHITHSAHLLVGDTFKYDDLMNSMDHSSQNDMNSLKVDSLSKSNVHTSSLDEPQKVVRWKTQVERLADEKVPGQQCESSPINIQNSSEPNKKKFCWSRCECGSCNPLKWSCWNDCWKCMSCSNCKPKKVGSSNPTEAGLPESAAPKKPDYKLSKVAYLKRMCCCKP